MATSDEKQPLAALHGDGEPDTRDRRFVDELWSVQKTVSNDMTEEEFRSAVHSVFSAHGFPLTLTEFFTRPFARTEEEGLEYDPGMHQRAADERLEWHYLAYLKRTNKGSELVEQAQERLGRRQADPGGHEARDYILGEHQQPDLVNRLVEGREFDLPYPIDSAIWRWLELCDYRGRDPYCSPSELEADDLEDWLRCVLASHTWITLNRLRDRKYLKAPDWIVNELFTVLRRAGGRVTAEKKRKETLSARKPGQPVGTEFASAYRELSESWKASAHGDSEVGSDVFYAALRSSYFPDWRGQATIDWGQEAEYTDYEIWFAEKHENKLPVSIKTLRNWTAMAKKDGLIP